MNKTLTGDRRLITCARLQPGGIPNLGTARLQNKVDSALKAAQEN